MRVAPDLPAGLAARAPRPDEAERAAELAAAGERALHGRVDVDAEDFAADWAQPSFELEDHAVFVLEGDRLVGSADVLVPKGRAEVTVHPDALGRGIGSSLRRWSEDLMAALVPEGPIAVDQVVSDADEAAGRLLRDAGYSSRKEAWLLETEHDAPPDRPTPPEGIAIRSLRPEDEREVHVLIQEAFSEWPGYHPYPFEDWLAITIGRADCHAEDVFLAVDGDAVVGAAVCFRYPDSAWVDQLAVRRTHRGRGIAGALLRHAFAELYRHGCAVTGLSTNSDTGALGLYERAGMHVVRTYRYWRKVLREA